MSDYENNPWAPPSTTPPSSPPPSPPQEPPYGSAPSDPGSSGNPDPGSEPTTQQPAWAPPAAASHERYGSWDDGFDATPAAAPKTSGGKKWVGVALVAALIGGGIGGAVVNAADNKDDKKATVSAAAPVPASQASDATATPQTIRGVLSKVKPAVVTINVEEADGSGTGTGMLVSPDGEVLTNAHVVKGATSIKVTLDGQKDAHNAKVLGIDTSIDSAMVKVDGVSDMPTVELGSSSDVQVGDQVVAIGNALALPGGPSVTTGIVSAKDRSVSDGTTSLDNLLQTDAAINPGNSGGPLANMSGQIIGMNTAVIRGQSGEFQNIGFALAIDSIKPAMSDLRSGKIVAQAYLGVATLTLDADIRQRFSVVPDKGAMIDTVQPSSPADDAGLSRYDVITRIDGKDIGSAEDLVSAVRSHRPGDKVDITYYEGGKNKKTVNITLGTRPAS